MTIYWLAIVLMMIGLYAVIAHSNMIKKVIGLAIFQSAVFILYIAFAKVSGATAPIVTTAATAYANPLPHVLILTAIVVGVATMVLALALVVRIYDAYGTIDEHALNVAGGRGAPGDSDEAATSALKGTSENQLR